MLALVDEAGAPQGHLFTSEGKVMFSVRMPSSDKYTRFHVIDLGQQLHGHVAGRPAQ
jgi:hypothetical protein